MFGNDYRYNTKSMIHGGKIDKLDFAKKKASALGTILLRMKSQATDNLSQTYI